MFLSLKIERSGPVVSAGAEVSSATVESVATASVAGGSDAVPLSLSLEHDTSPPKSAVSAKVVINVFLFFIIPPCCFRYARMHTTFFSESNLLTEILVSEEVLDSPHDPVPISNDSYLLLQ
jgi:hypothetical protein